MYLTIKQQLKHLSKEDYRTLKELSHIAKNLTNQAIYSIRQYYFQEKKFLRYESNYHILKSSDNYKILNSNMAQQILKKVDCIFKSFFGLIEYVQESQNTSTKVRLPHYLPKDGYTTLVIGDIRLRGNKLKLPFSKSYAKDHKPIEFTIPPVLADKKIKEIRIVPRANARFFEIHYVYETECIDRNLNPTNALAIDLGVKNLITAVTSTGESFIVDGRKLKSISQWFNKETARLQSIKDKQKLGKRQTNLQITLYRKRNSKVNDYMSKVARIAINYCLTHNIGTLVVGYNETFQRNANLGKTVNQQFVYIPYGKLVKKLDYLCKLNGIIFILQEESYTSKASFFDKDIIPTYHADSQQEYQFSGKRLKRGLYRRKDGRTLNADVNAALNILCKSKVVDLSILYRRGDVDTPVRIRVT